MHELRGCAGSIRGPGSGRNRAGIGLNSYNHSPPPGLRNNNHLNGYPSSPGGGGGVRTANVPVHDGSPVILLRLLSSADNYMTVPQPANLNPPRRGRRGRSG